VKKERMVGLQILRILACLGVFVCHLGAQLEVKGVPEKFMDFGATGVYLFFVLSGFLGLCSKDLENENRISGCIRYWIKRAFKILPLYYAVIIYNFVFYEFILKSTPIDSSGIGWPRYFLFLSTSIPADKNFWVNLSYTWTISIFVLFYLLAPLMKRFVTSYRSAVIHWGAWYVLSLICVNRVAYGMPFFFLHYFALGIVLFYAVKEEKIKQVITGCVVFVLGSLIMNETLTHNACAMLFMILIIMAKDMKAENTKLKKMIGTLDAYSYTVYLSHAVVMNGIEMIKNRVALSPVLILVIAVGCTFVGAVVVRNLVERPMEKLGNRILRARKQSNGSEL